MDKPPHLSGEMCVCVCVRACACSANTAASMFLNRQKDEMEQNNKNVLEM